MEAADKSNRQPEVEVDSGKNFLENIDFSLSNLSTVEVVEYLRENEGAENVSEQFLFHLSAPVTLAKSGSSLIISLDISNFGNIIIAV